jgi:predicted nucleic acid-binding protein
MAADPTFVDTNVLVYASQKRSAFHVQALACLQQARGECRALWISRQVLREYLATVTRPQRDQAPLPMAEAIAPSRDLSRTSTSPKTGRRYSLSCAVC